MYQNVFRTFDSQNASWVRPQRQKSKGTCFTYSYTTIMNKSEFIASVAEKAGLTKVDAQKAVNAFAEVVAEQLKAGERITLIGFGTFSTSERAERTGVNPRTGKTIKIAARRVAKFKPGSALEL